jgi:putative ABC transport system permease protein
MGILDAIQTGLSELFSHKMRSLLTMLGVIFGVAAVITMVSIGEGGKQTMLEQIRQTGIDVIHIKRGVVAGELMEKAQEKSPFGLKYSDAESIRKICTYSRQVLPVREIFADVKVGDRPVPVKVVGVSDGYDVVTRSAVERGRFMDKREVDSGIPVCVLGSLAKRELFGFTDPLGKTLRIGERLFTVIGVLATKELGDSQAFSALRDLNSDIYIPITISISDFHLYSQQPIPPTITNAIQLIEKSMATQSLGNSEVSEILVQVANENATVPTEAIVRRILDREHKGIRDFEIVIPAELLEQSRQTQKIFNIVMAAIASISLLVGGIGIMNIMLATVTQRTREIGVRRCIGATRWDIIRQFMLEALVITCLGGLIGVVFGIYGARGISIYANWRTVVSAQAIIISFSVSALVGVVFGMYPAIRAASIDPIEALRHS